MIKIRFQGNDETRMLHSWFLRRAGLHVFAPKMRISAAGHFHITPLLFLTRHTGRDAGRIGIADMRCSDQAWFLSFKAMGCGFRYTCCFRYGSPIFRT